MPSRVRRAPLAVRWRAHAPLVVLALSLAGCGWFGESEGPPLSGTRQPALERQRTLAADPQAAGRLVQPPPVTLNSDWPQAGGAPNHAVGHLGLAGAANLAWSASIGAGASAANPWLPQPVVGDGRVFTLDSANEVRAFDLGSGRELWRNDLAAKEDDDDAMAGGLAYDGGRVFVTTGFGKVVALNAADGKTLWSKKLGIPVHAPPTVSTGRVFVITVENQLFALSAETGGELWPPHQVAAEPARVLGAASPAVEGGIVVAPFSSGELAGVQAETGRVLWSDTLTSVRLTDELAAISQIRGAPVIDEGRVFAVSQAGSIAALDLRTGRRLWNKDFGGLGSPWLAGDFLYLITSDNELLCVAAGDGAVQWVTKLEAWKDKEKKRGAILWAGPVLAGGRLLVVGSNGEEVTVDPVTGKRLGSRPLRDSVRVPPVVANNTLLILDDGGRLSAYR